MSLAIIIFGNLYQPLLAHAQLSSCDVSLSPQSVTPNSNTFFTFGIYDSDPNPIQWVQITTPSGNYLNVEAAIANGWNGANTSSVSTFTGNTLASGSSQGFTVYAAAGGNETTSPIDWTVQASDDPGGANPITCDGDTSMTIVSQPSVINILSEGVTNLYPTQVTIIWTTDVASTSEVDYGLDTTYGNSTPTDNSLVTNHSVTLTGLTPNTGYHFQVTSTTPDGGSVTSGDDTFLTAVQQSGGGGSNNGGGGSSGGSSGGSGGGPTNNQQSLPLPSSSNSIPLLKKAVETTPPTINFIGTIPKVQKTMPTISGVATDNVEVADVEFSTDGGINWLPVQQITGLGTKSASFSFTPVNLDDGTYNIEARAINTSGISATTPTITIVIDRLDPLVGGNVISLGPQVLEPNQSGTITTMAGVDQKINLSTVGGPTETTLTAVNLDGKSKPQTFTLTKSSGDELWSGIIDFADAGEYTLIANTVNGAGIHINRSLNEFSVQPEAITENTANHKPIPAKVTVYYYVPATESWAVWDGASYGQNNPDMTGRTGKFGLFLPAGKYYLTAQAPGYRMLSTSIFTTTQTQPISTTLMLKPIHQLNLGFMHIDVDFPSLADQVVNPNNQQNSVAVKSLANSLIGKVAPNFSLTSTGGGTVNTTDLLGKPTVITFGTTWSPTMTEQIQTLSQLQANKNLNVIPVALQQGAAITRAYTAISDLNLNWLVDPDSTLSDSYKVQSLPTSYFIDRNGVVKKMVVGVLSRQQMLNILSGL